MNENRAGYNAYFHDTNVTALMNARMPYYVRDDGTAATAADSNTLTSNSRV